MPIRVVIAEDSYLVREGVVRLLETSNDVDVVATAEDYDGLLAATDEDGETALERQLSATIMRGGAKPDVRTMKKGRAVVEQGAPGDELFLLLDGVLDVVVDGEPIAEVGPGAILGERAVLEGGRRTATLQARTKCRVAVARADAVDREALATLSEGHRREDER